MKEYRKFQMLAARTAGKACRALHLTSPSIPSYRLDLDDKPLYKSKSNSWVRNMLNFAASQSLMGISPYNDGVTFFDDGYGNIRMPDGTIARFGNLQCSLALAVGNDAASQWGAGSVYGILVGASDTAETFNDYNLGGTIPHGSTEGCLNRSIQSMISREWVPSSRKWSVVMQRAFVNSSGANVTVKELGFFMYNAGHTGLYTNASSFAGVMLLRDVLPSPVTIVTGKTLTVTYTIEYSF